MKAILSKLVRVVALTAVLAGGMSAAQAGWVYGPYGPVYVPQCWTEYGYWGPVRVCN